MRTIASSFIVLLSLTVSAHAEPTVVVGNHVLLANTAGQLISITVSGIEPNTVNGITFAFEIDGGGPDYGGPLGPRITEVDVDSGPSIWVSPNSAGHNVPNVFIDASGQWGGVDFITTTGFVNVASGIVITLQIDTTGIAGGVHSLSLVGNNNDDAIALNFGPSHFTGQNFVSSITDGTIFMPEPSSVVLGLLGIAVFGVIALRKRHARTQRAE